MTRVMGDAIHANVASLPKSIQLVAGYDTGTPDILWTPADWARFPNIPQVHIDQGFGSTRATEAHVMVFDVEAGAFSPDQAGVLCSINTTARPTLYCNQSNVIATCQWALTSPNFKGDVWLAFPGWSPGIPLPALPAGCKYVAVQDQTTGTYDLSTVIDDFWPEVEMAPQTTPVTYCNKCQGIFVLANAAVSVCPAGGQHNVPADALTYLIIGSD